MTVSSGPPSASASVDSSLIDHQEAALLLARLQSQFGDLNVNSFLTGSTNANYGNCDSSLQRHDDDDDDSSYEEPTAEELAAWQEAQFQNGRRKLQAVKSTASIEAEERRRKCQLSQQPHDGETATWSTMPNFANETSAFFPSPRGASMIHPLLSALVAVHPEVLGTTWKNLFSSSINGDGLSFQTLTERIRGYNGPMVFLFGGVPSPSYSLSNVAATCDEKKRVSLGCFSPGQCVWTGESFRFCSDNHTDCFLFGLDYDAANVAILRPKTRSVNAPQNYLSCHPSAETISNYQNLNGSTAFHGIQIGGNITSSSSQPPKLHISESFEQCRALPHDATFQAGDILLGTCNDSLYYFDVDCIEVWGVGGRMVIEDALAAREKERGVRVACLERVRKVLDKRQFLEDFENGLVWSRGGSSVSDGGLFGHASCVQERDI